jgi:hypothetical protein
LDKELSNKIDLVDFDLRNDFYALLDSLGEVVELGYMYVFTRIRPPSAVRVLDQKIRIYYDKPENFYIHQIIIHRGVKTS